MLQILHWFKLSIPVHSLKMPFVGQGERLQVEIPTDIKYIPTFLFFFPFSNTLIFSEFLGMLF